MLNSVHPGLLNGRIRRHGPVGSDPLASKFDVKRFHGFIRFLLGAIGCYQGLLASLGAFLLLVTMFATRGSWPYY